MRKAFLVFGTVVLLCFLSIPYGYPGANGGEISSKAPAQAAPPLARVRVIERGIARVTKIANVITAEKPSTKNPPSLLLDFVDQPDIEEEDRLFLDRVFRALPALCRENIEHLIVRYDQTAERGQATATTMLLRGPLWNLSAKKKMEMVGVITHECGHIMSLKALRGKPSQGMSRFPDGRMPTYNGPAAQFYALSWKNSEQMRTDAQSDDFVSGYAKQNPFEDIAESIAYFILQEQAFRERAQINTVLAEKLAWVERYIGGEFTPPGSTMWDGKIPWDVTKLPHGLAL